MVKLAGCKSICFVILHKIRSECCALVSTSSASPTTAVAIFTLLSEKYNPALASQARDEELIVARLAELTPLEAEGDGTPSAPPPAAEIEFIIRAAGRRVCTDPKSGLTHVGAERANRERQHHLLVPLN